MMPDEIIEELWAIKDSIAREHDNDVRKLAAYLGDGESRKHSTGAVARSDVDAPDEASGQRSLKTSEEGNPVSMASEHLGAHNS